MKFNCFLTDNLPDYVMRDHRLCCDYVGIDVSYTVAPAVDEFDEIYRQHGIFMEKCIAESKDDVVCFIDIDALPYDKIVLQQAFNWVKKNKSFIGNAQNISHTKMRNQIYAAASMLMVSKSSYEDLGKPMMAWHYSSDGEQIDTAQQLTINADLNGFKYRLFYPIGFDSKDKRYDLGGFGEYGEGTLYPGTWHYFRISGLKTSNPPEIWKKRVSEITAGIKPQSRYASRFYGLDESRKSWIQRFVSIIS